MANLAIIQAKRYVDGQVQNCVYLGSIQNNGWIYFNDDVFWRAKADKSVVQLLYLSKEIWVNTNSLELTSISNINATQAQNIINGAGPAADSAAVENAVQWAINKVTNNYITYDYTTNSARDVNSLQYNCSTFVITAFWQAGFPINTAVNTATMVADFEACGFTFYSGNYWDASDLVRGDIQINIPLLPSGHTNIYIGNNQDVDCGGEPGAIFTHTPDNWGRGWDGILRYTG